MGLATELVSQTVKAGRVAGLSDEDLYVLGKDEGQPFIQAMINALKDSLKLNLDADLGVLVNYGETLEVKIDRLKKFGLTFSNEDINSENFPVPEGRSGTMKMRLALPKLKRTISTNDAMKFVAGRGLEVGDPYQLLDLIEQNWDRLQQQMTTGLWVTALSTSWQSRGGNHCVVYLYCRGSSRELGLRRVERGWLDVWRLLGSRSVPSNT
jgi:hypothetical protein